MDVKLITFNPKVYCHDDFLNGIGYAVRLKGGVWELLSPAGIVTDATEISTVQAQIDAYDPLPDERKRWADAVDVAAGEARSRYITIVPGQDPTYQLKREQAIAHKAAGYPADLTDYGMVQVEMNAENLTAQQATDYLLGKATSWIALATAIEDLRRTAKTDMDAATTAASIDSIAQTAIVSLDAI